MPGFRGVSETQDPSSRKISLICSDNQLQQIGVFPKTRKANPKRTGDSEQIGVTEKDESTTTGGNIASESESFRTTQTLQECFNIPPPRTSPFKNQGALSEEEQPAMKNHQESKTNPCWMLVVARLRSFLFPLSELPSSETG